ncbi:uncharacterized protein BDR25DRAFT_360008 [Lindgomyces ingoldianus]|uniref:Uncharacterized protein n=1 Tax=Lindgomyces ingoldianus TaxID=673940 RepID=A0ACB6QH66_9PLEO|nr:uncharacterized protein BDR25DRAFT_360008 [Lindgomyces ingoldianus]KAF2465850.1 hypothetical protein BDR25DRAFT_360008 [Lindgomyces ingoldianus]
MQCFHHPKISFITPLPILFLGRMQSPELANEIKLRAFYPEVAALLKLTRTLFIAPAQPDDESNPDPKGEAGNLPQYDPTTYYTDDDFCPRSQPLEPLRPRITPSPSPLPNIPKERWDPLENLNDYFPAGWFTNETDQTNVRQIMEEVKKIYLGLRALERSLIPKSTAPITAVRRLQSLRMPWLYGPLQRHARKTWPGEAELDSDLGSSDYGDDMRKLTRITSAIRYLFKVYPGPQDAGEKLDAHTGGIRLSSAAPLDYDQDRKLDPDYLRIVLQSEDHPDHDVFAMGSWDLLEGQSSQAEGHTVLAGDSLDLSDSTFGLYTISAEYQRAPESFTDRLYRRTVAEKDYQIPINLDALTSPCDNNRHELDSGAAGPEAALMEDTWSVKCLSSTSCSSVCSLESDTLTSPDSLYIAPEHLAPMDPLVESTEVTQPDASAEIDNAIHIQAEAFLMHTMQLGICYHRSTKVSITLHFIGVSLTMECLATAIVENMTAGSRLTFGDTTVPSTGTLMQEPECIDALMQDTRSPNNGLPKRTTLTGT